LHTSSIRKESPARDLARRDSLSSGRIGLWSVSESATDVMFDRPATLARLYPALIRQGIPHFASTDVLRFLGHKTQANGNSIKLYDKQGSVRRVETTLNRPHQFRVYRPSERDPGGKKRWQVLRKSVGDLHRRAEICEAANGRHLEALASVRAGRVDGERLSQPRCAGSAVSGPGGRAGTTAPKRPSDTRPGALAGARTDQESRRQLPLPVDPPRPTNHHRTFGRTPSRRGKTHRYGRINSLPNMYEPSSLYYGYGKQRMRFHLPWLANRLGPPIPALCKGI
jgi:hypothetical protein